MLEFHQIIFSCGWNILGKFGKIATFQHKHSNFSKVTRPCPSNPIIYILWLDSIDHSNTKEFILKDCMKKLNGSSIIRGG